MNESIALVQKHLRIVWRFRWIALLTAFAFCTVGWLTVLILPDKYEVGAKVYLDTQSILDPLLQGIGLENTTQVDTAVIMQRTLLVRPNLEQVIRKTDMDLSAQTPEQFEKLVSGLASDINVSGTIEDNIFNIRYSNPDAKLATRVVDALLNLFVERSLGESRKDSSKSREFLDAQVREYEARLIAAEARLKEFKRQNVGIMPSSGNTYYGRLEAIGEQLAEANLLLVEAGKRRDALRGNLADVREILAAAQQSESGAGIEHSNDSRIESLETQLDQLLLSYTDKHPDVISTVAMLDRLRKEREADIEEMMADLDDDQKADGENANNPIYQELKVELSGAEAEVAALQARVTEYEARQKHLRELVDTVPQVEAELAKLNRDYDNDRKNYDALVQRREALEISEEASQTADDIQFNIIEPPVEPLVPTDPNRPALNVLVLFAALAAGITLAWGVGMLRPAFYTKDDFNEFTDVPVLGSISRVWTRGEVIRRRAEVVTITVGFLCLIGAYGGLVYIDTLGVDLASKVGDLRERLL